MATLPISFANVTQWSWSCTTPSCPGIMLTLAAEAILLLSILSPIARIASEFGPINWTPISA